MIWVVLAIIVAALIIANAIKQQSTGHYPIQDPNDPNYKLAYRIISDYLDDYSRLTLTGQMNVLWHEKLANSKNAKERKENEKSVKESDAATEETVNEFWSRYGGYNKMLDPIVVPLAVWPKELVDKYNAQRAAFAEMNERVKNSQTSY
ncbi:MAG TPA: hypothetical protein VMR75_02360 [Candidatus Saccharimonadales bacterium]|nr:hypothetical protein [Candidatus Saccharimonadales bacterium]